MKLTEITSLWIKQIPIGEPSILLNLIHFDTRFCFTLFPLCMTTIAQKMKIKFMADVGNHMFYIVFKW